MALALNDGTVALCEPGLGRLVRVLEAGTPLTTLARTQPLGRVVAGTEDGQVLIWDLETGKRTAFPTGFSGSVREMDVSVDGTVVAITSGRVVFLRPGEEPHWIEGLNCGVWNPGVVFNPDGTRIATLEFAPGEQAGYTANVGLWDVSSGQRLAMVDWRGDPHCLAFSPDGSLLAVGNRQRDVLLVDGETLAPVADMLGHFSTVDSLAFVPDGTKLVSTSRDGSLRIWSVEERRTVNVLRHGWTRALLALEPNGKCVTAVGMEGGGARAWALESVGADSSARA